MKKGISNKQIENLTQQGFCDKSFDVQKGLAYILIYKLCPLVIPWQFDHIWQTNSENYVSKINKLNKNDHINTNRM